MALQNLSVQLTFPGQLYCAVSLVAGGHQPVPASVSVAANEASVYGHARKPYQHVNQFLTLGPPTDGRYAGATMGCSIDLVLLDINGNELTAGNSAGYARLNVSFTGANFQVNADGLTVSNKVALTF